MKILCKLGIHLNCVYTLKGIKCLDCEYFKDKYTEQADLHAGG